MLRAEHLLLLLLLLLLLWHFFRLACHSLAHSYSLAWLALHIACMRFGCRSGVQSCMHCRLCFCVPWLLCACQVVGSQTRAASTQAYCSGCCRCAGLLLPASRCLSCIASNRLWADVSAADVCCCMVQCWSLLASPLGRCTGGVACVCHAGQIAGSFPSFVIADLCLSCAPIVSIKYLFQAAVVAGVLGVCTSRYGGLLSIDRKSVV